MICQEIVEIIGIADDGSALNDLADQFRLGRDIKDIIPALSSGDINIILCAIWIVGELPSHIYNNELVLDFIYPLLNNSSAAVRLGALSALFPVFEKSDARALLYLEKLNFDSNEVIRSCAEKALLKLRET